MLIEGVGNNDSADKSVLVIDVELHIPIPHGCIYLQLVLFGCGAVQVKGTCIIPQCLPVSHPLNKLVHYR
jgi:hypothetical protein